MIERRCEAEVHADFCSGRGSTHDHFTPVSVAIPQQKYNSEVYGRYWPNKFLNGEENKQMLSSPCHSLKDSVWTPIFADRAKRLARGGEVTLWEHHNDEVFMRQHLKMKSLLKHAA